MAFEWSYKNQNLSYQGKNQWNIDQGKENLIRLSEELELSSGVRVNLVKMTEKLMGKIQEKLDLVWVSGEFVLSECELSGFYCKGLCSNYQEGGGGAVKLELSSKNLDSTPPPKGDPAPIWKIVFD